MSRYFTRLKTKRIYTWGRERSHINRKLNVFYYDSLYLNMKGKSEAIEIQRGQYILIESDDDDKPYVAKLLSLFSDGSMKNKRAKVQWFVHFSEVPHKKRKLLGREPHPREVFLYQDDSCESEIDAETIMGTVQVVHLAPDLPFPQKMTNGTLYVKLSWDTKAFTVVDREKLTVGDKIVPVPGSRSFKSNDVPTPKGTDAKRALVASFSQVSASRSKAGSREAESARSVSKHSASKIPNQRHQSSCNTTPRVRKRLELSSPGKSQTRDEVLEDLLTEEIQCEVELARMLPSSPQKFSAQVFNLSPNKPSSKVSNGLCLATAKTGQSLLGTIQSPRRHDQDSTRARTPSRRKVASSPIREPALGAVAEEFPEVSSQTAGTPRTRRKSALLVSSRIRKQLNLLDTTQDVLPEDSDSNDSGDGCFVPSKRDLESSTEDEEDVKEEIDEDSVIVKKRRQFAVSRTPRSRRKGSVSERTPRKTPRKKDAPCTPRTPRHATPSIPTRVVPVRNPGNVLEEARVRLHVSSVPESLPCREQEFQDIYSFVESKIIDGTGGCMYISGVPGTGKTATVHEVVRCLQQASEQDDIPPFHFIEINGMKMTDPHQAYVQILQSLTGQKATADHAAALLEKRFSNPVPKKETTVLLVDELDLLWTRKQNVMYNLFDWPTRRHARLVALAIANTMDLPERIMMNRVASRLGLTRMSFQPYSFRQLQQIVTSRLNGVRAFEEDALQLVSRKVAALSGDARRCLDICRRATEICEQSGSCHPGSGLVGMSHVMEALDEMFSSSYITAIRCASVQEQLFLRAVIAEFRRLGLEEATFQQVFVQHQALCRVEGLRPISVSEGLAVCQRLGACRLLLLESSRLDLLLRVRLNVSQDDVLFALKED